MVSGPTPTQIEVECRAFSLAIQQVGTGPAVATGRITARSDERSTARGTVATQGHSVVR